jgi:hypothetical protein
MYTTPPITGFIVLSVIGILMLATIPVVALTLYDRTEITSHQADTVGDAKINAANEEP